MQNDWFPTLPVHPPTRVQAPGTTPPPRWASLPLWASSFPVSCIYGNEELAYFRWKPSPSYIFTNHSRCCISPHIQRSEILSSSFCFPDASTEVPPPARWPSEEEWLISQYHSQICSHRCQLWVRFCSWLLVSFKGSIELFLPLKEID